MLRWMRCSNTREFVDLAVIEAARRLVEQQQLRARHQRARQLDALLRGEGQRAGRRYRRPRAGRAGPAARPAAPAAACSSRRTTGRRSALAMKPERPVWCAPTSMLSRTLMLRNSATFWNVRPMPRPAMRWRGMPGQRLVPSNSDIARAGAVEATDAVEQRGLAGAVGADQAADLPRPTSKDTPFSATTPPKRTATSRTLSRGGAIVAHQVRGRRGAMRRPVTPFVLPECLKPWHAGTLAASAPRRHPPDAQISSVFHKASIR